MPCAAHHKEIPLIMVEAICTKNMFAQWGNEFRPHFTVGNTYIASITAKGSYQLENDNDTTLVLKKEVFRDHFMEVN